MDYNQAQEDKAALRYFKEPSADLLRWERRYERRNLASLEERSHHPHRSRQPAWSTELARAVLEIREQRPRWGKYELAVLPQKLYGRANTTSAAGNPKDLGLRAVAPAIQRDYNSLKAMGKIRMKRVSVRQLKSRLSEYLSLVKVGEEIVVTERGRSIAKIVPLCSSESLPDRLMDMERQGFIRLGSGRLPEGFWEIPRVQDVEGRALEALRAARAEDI